MNTFTDEPKYSSYENCYFNVSRYCENDNLAVTIMNSDLGVISRATVNPGVSINDDWIFLKDYSENEGTVDWFLREGLIESYPTIDVESGWVVIKAYKLTEKGKSIIKT